MPVQVRLPKELVDGVKAKLQEHGMTFTELIRGACQWYLELPQAAIAEKRRHPRALIVGLSWSMSFFVWTLGRRSLLNSMNLLYKLLSFRPPGSLVIPRLPV